MRLIIITTIYKWWKCRCHLNHIYIDILSKRVTCCINDCHLLTDCKTGFLARQINACPVTKSKKCLIFRNFHTTKLCCNLHHSRITWLDKTFFYCNSTMSAVFMAVDYASADFHETAAVKCIAIMYNTFLKSLCYRKWLESWTRLIYSRNTIITPQCIHGISHLYISHCAQFFLCVHTTQVSRIVKIKCRITCHCKNLPRLWIHCNYSRWLWWSFGI